MNTWREEKKINRPLLYATGGLVLGETMALFLTADQGFFWLAAMLAVLCCALSGSFRRGGAGGGGREPALFLHGKAGPWLRYGLAAAGCILLGFGRMNLEIRERVLEEQAAAERREEPLVIEGQVEEIGETDYGYRLMVSDCEEYGPEARRIPRRMYCYTDRADGLKIGMRIRAEGTMEAPEPERNPGGFDHRSFCRAKGIGGIFRADWAAPAGPGYSRFREGIRQIRLRLEGRLDQLASGTDGGILKAVLLGDRSDMDQEIYELYRKNGISHVLAISGLHVSILGLGLWKALRRCGFGFAAAGGAAGAFLFCYGLMTGFGPSVVRAAAMCGLSFLAAFLGRTYDLMSALCIPALALLWSRPCLLTQASFQLSFLAAGAVAFPGGFLIRRFKARGLFQTLLVSASIQAATAPAVLYHSFELPLYGIFLNLLVIPLMTYVVVSGLLGLAASLFSMKAGAALLGGAHYILGLYKAMGEGTQRLPGASLVVGRPSLAAMVLFLAGAFLGILLASRILEQRRSRPQAFLILCLFWAGSVFFFFSPPRKGLSAVFLDVGQGDGIFLSCGGRTMLMDCGSSQEKELGKDCLVPFLKSRGVDRLDTVFISHGDWDHISGIRYALEEPGCGIRIGTLVMPEPGKGKDVYAELACLADSRGIPVVYGKRGDEFSGILGPEVSICCLSPPEGGDYGDRNDESLVAEIQYGDFRLLLTGDVGKEGEEKMREAGLLAPVTVLKAAHHGSGTSSGQEFLKTVDPAFAVLSCGRENRYGHPSPEVVKALKEQGARIWDTRERGAVMVWTDGRTMDISGYLDSRKGI